MLTGTHTIAPPARRAPPTQKDRLVAQKVGKSGTSDADATLLSGFIGGWGRCLVVGPAFALNLE